MKCPFCANTLPEHEAQLKTALRTADFWQKEAERLCSERNGLAEEVRATQEALSAAMRLAALRGEDCVDLTARHAALLDIVRRVAEYFADTDAPLGVDARAALAELDSPAHIDGPATTEALACPGGTCGPDNPCMACENRREAL